MTTPPSVTWTREGEPDAEVPSWDPGDRGELDRDERVCESERCLNVRDDEGDCMKRPSHERGHAGDHATAGGRAVESAPSISPISAG